MKTTSRQTIGRHAHGSLRLSGSKTSVLSPYFQMKDLRKEATRQEYSFILVIMKAIYGLDYVAIQGGNQYVGVGFFDTTTNPATCTDVQNLQIDMGDQSGPDTLATAAIAAITTYATAQGYTLSGGIWPVFSVASAVQTLSSYQTIVTQAGTTAPAVSGSLAPVSTYPSGTTFTWARTSAGVYTLTASTAVFNTAGKTGVFVGSLNNLNAQYTVAVTSSTVITITTAVQSLAVLGLLGFTATATDALMTKTMIYVQTYP